MYIVYVCLCFKFMCACAPASVCIQAKSTDDWWRKPVGDSPTLSDFESINEPTDATFNKQAAN